MTQLTSKTDILHSTEKKGESVRAWKGRKVAAKPGTGASKLGSRPVGLMME
jgi:hypothetical protein